MGIVINFFSHKAHVGKTNLVKSIGTSLYQNGYKVLLIDADPRMDLTSDIFYLSTLNDNLSNKKISDYMSIYDYLTEDEIKKKLIFRCASEASKNVYLDLITGCALTYEIDIDIYNAIKNKNGKDIDIIFNFNDSINELKKHYDFILVDTCPNPTSVINALIMMTSDYFINPLSAGFFSTKVVDTLSSIFTNWISLLGEYQLSTGFSGLPFHPKFLFSLICKSNVLTVKDINTRWVDRWMVDINRGVKKFQIFASRVGMSITQEQFNYFFGEQETPFVLKTCSSFDSSQEQNPCINKNSVIFKECDCFIDRITSSLTKIFHSIS